MDQKPGEIFKGIAYRAESGYTHERGQTAWDIVKFETEKLGNTDIMDQAKKSGLDLKSIPARKTVWVTNSKKKAEKYGEPVEYSIPAGSRIIATDGEGGYLLALGSIKNVKAMKIARDMLRKALLSPSEALYGFCGWLTSRDDETVMSGHNDAAHIADLVDIFCKTNELPNPQDGWEKELIHPKFALTKEFDSNLKGRHYKLPSVPALELIGPVVEATGFMAMRGNRKYVQIVRQFDKNFNPMPEFLPESGMEPTDKDLTQLPYMPEHLKKESKEDENIFGKHFKDPYGREFIANGMYKDSPVGKYIEVVPEEGTKRQFILEKDLKPVGKTADYPDHPDEVVISKSDNILGKEPIKEIDIWNYYEGIKSKFISELKENDLFIVIKPDSKPIYIRHPYDKKTKFIRIGDEKSFEEYHSGRTVEYHITAASEIPFYAVDMDPPGDSPDDFNRAKKAAGEIADALGRIPDVSSVSINYTGKRGFHIFGKLKGKKNVDNARKFMQEWLKETFGDNSNYTLGETPKENKIALGVAPLKINGGHVALWSLRISGLCCVEVPRKSLADFKREEATIDKVYRKLTGRAFPWGQEKERKMARHVISMLILK